MCRTRANDTYGIGTLQKQNAELMKQVSQQNQVIQQTQRMTGELMKQVAELTKGAE